jgi:oxysterol-binding protein 1
MSPPQNNPASLEQSVRLFRYVEALRGGDREAIAKAMKEQELGSPARLQETTLLHLAIQCADLPVIERVLANTVQSEKPAAGLNARDKDGNTPLHLAARLGRIPVVRALLEQDGINDSVSNLKGETALDVAYSADIFQELQLARSLYVDSNVRRIHSLVAQKDYGGLEKLLNDSRVRTTIDLNGMELATDRTSLETGGTLLHEAARKRDVKLIQLLLMNGADPFRRDRKGKLAQDVTKDEKTRHILKKSPAAEAAKRSVQEKSILGAANSQAGSSSNLGENPLGGKESREMKGYLKKWTNYTSGWKLRWFVLEEGVLSYYKHQGITHRIFETLSSHD